MSLVASALLSGCPAPPRTELIVVVTNDLDVPAQIDRIRLDVVTPSGRELRTNGAACSAGLPQTFALGWARGALGPLEVEVTGALNGLDVATARAVTSFVSGASLRLDLALEHACVEVVCDDGATCRAGECVDEDLRPEDLPAWNGSPAVAGCGRDAGVPDEDAEVTDADAGGAPDADASDASDAATVDSVYPWVLSIAPVGGAGLAIDADGRVAVTGYFVGEEVDFGWGAIAAQDESDGFVAFYSSAGELVAFTQLGGEGTTVPTAIAAQPGGGVIVTGRFSGSPDFGRPLDPPVVTGNNRFLATYDRSGSLDALRTYNVVYNTEQKGLDLVALAMSPDGVVYAGGSLEGELVRWGGIGPMQFDERTWFLGAVDLVYGSHAIVPPPNERDQPGAVRGAVLTDDGVLLAGAFSGPTASGGAFLKRAERFSSGGVWLPVRDSLTLGTPNEDRFAAVAKGPDGGWLVGATISGIESFGGVDGGFADGASAVIAWLDGDLNGLRTTTVRGDASAYSLKIRSVGMLGDGRVFAAGMSTRQELTAGDLTTGSDAGLTFIWVLVMDAADGTPVWFTSFASGNIDNELLGAAASRDELAIYVGATLTGPVEIGEFTTVDPGTSGPAFALVKVVPPVP